VDGRADRAVVTTAFGDTATLTVLGPGEIFGELALIRDQAKRSATVVALEPVETLSVSRAQFEALRAGSPAFDRFLVEALGALVVRLTEHLLEALFVPVEQRVLRRLLTLAGQYGGDAPSTVIPLSQEELATMAGTTRPTANRVLRGAEQRGLIRVGRGRVEILDPAALARQAR
jgi:CRP-like cAMP-binding protein